MGIAFVDFVDFTAPQTQRLRFLGFVEKQLEILLGGEVVIERILFAPLGEFDGGELA